MQIIHCQINIVILKSHAVLIKIHGDMSVIYTLHTRKTVLIHHNNGQDHHYTLQDL